ncbi:hypothetical protein ACOBQX_08175 [Actinokineospora sp. G85]|uniref:hypothetical protein n=1 Tax=Actinokineospora sp. G85 TaxID=3406626 RepID=UPI003C73527E
MFELVDAVLSAEGPAWTLVGLSLVPGCVFLVSVSDDALMSFERRGIPVRDALDSAFTTMIAVEPFTLDEARTWMDRRVIGLPDPFACLCFCLSAGIPRELVRSAAALHDLYQDSPGIPVQGAARRIVAAETAAKLRAFSHSAGRLPASPAATDLVVALNTAGLTRGGAAALLPRLTDLARSLHTEHDKHRDGEPEVARLAEEAASHLHLSVTIVELFSHLDAHRLDSLTRAAASPTLEDLAVARRALAVDPHLSWVLTARFRDAAGMAALDR